MDGGRWTVDTGGGHWKVDGGQWTLDGTSSRLMSTIVRWTPDGGRWTETVDGGHWTLDVTSGRPLSGRPLFWTGGRSRSLAASPAHIDKVVA